MKLVKLIIVSRHGQRTPIHCTKEDKEYFKQNVQLLQNPETQVFSGQLTKRGYEQHKQLIQLFQQKHPAFFSSLQPEHVFARATNFDRVVLSAQAELEQLNIKVDVFVEKGEDPFLFQNSKRYNDFSK